MRKLKRLSAAADWEWQFANLVGHMFYAINGALREETNPISIEDDDDYVRSTVRDVVRWVRQKEGA